MALQSMLVFLITTSCQVLLMWVEEVQVEGNCDYIVLAVVDSQQGVFLQPQDLVGGNNST
jgi:hypothetical protein